MKNFALFSMLALLAAAPLAGADEAVRAAQTALQQSGYYTGEANGELNEETRSALRRFQIRQELEPSGNLTPDTVAALNRETGAQPAPAAPPAPAPRVPTAPPVRPPEPPPAVDPSLAALFARTPLENAAPGIQSETIRKAQVQLSEKRLYLGPVNGRPSGELEKALFRYQSARKLPITGRLDIDTLAAMRLLPVAKIKRPRVEPKPYVPKPPPPGAVRGVPLD